METKIEEAPLMKKCTKCGLEKTLDCYSRDNSKSSGYREQCKSCRNLVYKKYCETHREAIAYRHKQYQESNREAISSQRKRYRDSNREAIASKNKRYRDSNRELIMCCWAKNRSKKKNLDFNIDVSDIVIPETCPVLGIPLYLGNRILSPNSPTIDRIDSSKGYVKGNVRVISSRANTLKNNATLEELRLVYEDSKKLSNDIADDYCI